MTSEFEFTPIPPKESLQGHEKTDLLGIVAGDYVVVHFSDHRFYALSLERVERTTATQITVKERRYLRNSGATLNNFRGVKSGVGGYIHPLSSISYFGQDINQYDRLVLWQAEAKVERATKALYKIVQELPQRNTKLRDEYLIIAMLRDEHRALEIMQALGFLPPDYARIIAKCHSVCDGISFRGVILEKQKEAANA